MVQMSNQRPDAYSSGVIQLEKDMVEEEEVAAVAEKRLHGHCCDHYPVVLWTLEAAAEVEEAS